MTALVYEGSKGWKIDRHLGIEVLTSPDGIEYVRARKDEEPAAIIRPKTRGLGETHLVLRATSRVVRAADRKKRKDDAELRKRGYDVP